MKQAVPHLSGGSRANLSGPIARLIPGTLLVYIVCILALHTMPTGSASLGSAEIGSVRPNHFVHLIMFLPWGILAVEYFRDWPGGNLCRAVGCTLLGVILAAFAEGIQHLLPYRKFNPADLGMNVSGVITGLALALLWQSGLLSLQRRVKRSDKHSSETFSPTD